MLILAILSKRCMICLRSLVLTCCLVNCGQGGSVDGLPGCAAQRYDGPKPVIFILAGIFGRIFRVFQSLWRPFAKEWIIFVQDKIVLQKASRITAAKLIVMLAEFFLQKAPKSTPSKAARQSRMMTFALALAATIRGSERRIGVSRNRLKTSASLA